jgi:hypothetical protein
MAHQHPKMYVVRFKPDGRSKCGEIVGFFYTTINGLFWAIDECTDPTICQFAELPEGSIFWESQTKVTWPPLANRKTDDDNFNMTGASISENWMCNQDDAIEWKSVIKSVPDPYEQLRQQGKRRKVSEPA